jgi:hypothetical protein
LLLIWKVEGTVGEAEVGEEVVQEDDIHELPE